MESRKLVAATRNPGKMRELRDLLTDLPMSIRSLDDYAVTEDVEETGSTFIANAELKASAYALLTGEMVLSDDSGLAVVALGGAPGILSARYAGTDASDAERIAKLLGELNGADDRRGHFVCAIAVADRRGKILRSVEGICRGTIATEPRGDNGFGYDPVFVPDGFNTSFGEISDSIKSRISHRAAASRQILRFFEEFCRNLT